VSSKVKVVNSVWNGNGIIKRAVAESYVSEGRAEWVEKDQLRLVPTHQKNRAAAARANAWEMDYRPTADTDRITQALRLFGPSPAKDKYGRRGGGLAALNHRKARLERPPRRARAFDSGRQVLRDTLMPHESTRDFHDAVRPNGLPTKWRTMSLAALAGDAAGPGSRRNAGDQSRLGLPLDANRHTADRAGVALRAGSA